MKPLNVLVACEYSGIVRDAFIARGHNAMSCDLRPALSKGPHYQGDVFDIIDNGWDLLIAHPPCTHLASSGARWFHKKQTEQTQALAFFNALLTCQVPQIAIENPVGIVSTRIRKPDQIIQPWQFGDSYQKTTCLWLVNLPLLVPTNIVSKGVFVQHGGRKISQWYSNRTRPRDMTFPGIADAMALTWG